MGVPGAARGAVCFAGIGGAWGWEVHAGSDRCLDPECARRFCIGIPGDLGAVGGHGGLVAAEVLPFVRRPAVGLSPEPVWRELVCRRVGLVFTVGDATGGLV
jgi:hypothetical protein